jgi:multiple sugar transport system permease protein
MHNRLTQLLLISPSQFLAGAFILIPGIYVGWLSLNSSTFGAAPEFVGLSNYVQVLSDPYFWRAFRNTFIAVNAIVYLELLLGLGMALLFASGVPFPRLLVAIVFLPYAVSEAVAIVMWKYMFDPQIGVATSALKALGLPILDWAVDPVHAFVLVILIATWQHLPFTFIILYTARLGIPDEIYEAARLDGGSPPKIFWYVTLRLLIPAMLIALLFRYIFAFRLFSEVWLLTEGGPARQTEVLAIYLYRVAFRYSEFGPAAATGWAMVILSFAITIFYMRAMYRRTFA